MCCCERMKILPQRGIKLEFFFFFYQTFAVGTETLQEILSIPSRVVLTLSYSFALIVLKIINERNVLLTINVNLDSSNSINTKFTRILLKKIYRFCLLSGPVIFIPFFLSYLQVDFPVLGER